MTHRWTTVGLALVLAGVPLEAAPRDFERQAEQIVSVPGRLPGMAILVTEKGTPIWSRTVGKADRAANVDVATDSLFRYGSITKQFTAALILKLVEEGQLGVDDPAARHVPGLPSAWAPVTVRQLLTHTSGIPSYTSVPGWMVEHNYSRPHSTAELLALTADKPLDFEPGTDWRYNNSGYVLLSAIAEQLSGKPWYAALREKVTGPLGLSSIRCGCEPGSPTINGYDGDKLASRIDMTVPSGAGALVGNVGDLARWSEALHGGRVLRPDLYREMTTPVTLKGGRKHPYGFGLATGDLNGLASLSHGGGIPGFVTFTTYLPERKIFAAVLGNDEGPASQAVPVLANRLAAAAASKPLPRFTRQALDVAAITPFLGVYAVSSGGERQLFLKDRKLYTRRNAGTASEVLSAGGNRFFYDAPTLNWFELVRQGGDPPRMLFYSNGSAKADVAVWRSAMPTEVPAVTLDPAALASLVGSYSSGPAVLTIAGDAKGLTAQLTGQQAIALEATGPRDFRTVGVDARLVFEEANGKVSRVILHQGGRTIPFERK